MSKSRRSSIFSPVSARGGGQHELDVSRITRRLHIKIQTTTHGCFASLYLLVGVSDTTADQTPFPLLQDEHVELHEWHIDALDAHWAAPALSESAARAANIFKIPVSTDMALDESEPTNTAVVVSMSGNLNLIVPAGTAPAGQGSAIRGAHAESGKRGYLVTLIMRINHLRDSAGWPLQVTVPVPRSLMNTFDFRISSSDSISAKDSPIRIFPKLIGGSFDDASSPSSTLSSAPKPDSEALAIRRCSIVTGPKLKGMFAATSHLSLAWLRAGQSNAGQGAHNPKIPILQPLSTLQAQINTTWTSAAPRNGSEARLISFETVCTLIGFSHLGIDERAYLKLHLQGSDARITLSEVKLVTSGTRSGSSRGVIGIRTGPPPGSSTGSSTSNLSRIPSLRTPRSAAVSPPTNTLDLGMLDTTILDDNGDLMQVAPPKGLFNHDLSFSVDHQAFVDESAISDMSTLEKVKQLAGGVNGAGAPGSELSNPGRGNDDLPKGLLADPNSFAVVVDVDETLGVLPSRLKDNITLQFEGKICVAHLDAAQLQDIKFAMPSASHAQTRSTIAQQLQRLIDDEEQEGEALQIERDQDRQAKLKAKSQQQESSNRPELQGGAAFANGRRAGPRSLSSESISTPTKHSTAPSYFPSSVDDPMGTPTRKKLSRTNTAGSSSEVGDTTVIHPAAGPSKPPERPVAHQRKSSYAATSPQVHEEELEQEQEPGLASPLHAPLVPNLARALRKRATSDERSTSVASVPKTAGTPSPPPLGVPRTRVGSSDESVGSYGSGHKRGEWPAVLSAGTASGSSRLLAAAVVADQSIAPADWTMQDLSGSVVGDQSLSHGVLPYTLHEATVEVVPTLRRMQDEEEVRMVKKVMVPAWPRAELDGRSVLVPSVALIMNEGAEVVSVWCDHGRLRWMRLSAEDPDVDRDLEKGAVLIKVELPASLRNARSSSSDQCKLEIRIASAWSGEDAAKLRKGDAVLVEIPVLDCAVGTLDLRFCKPSDAWTTPVGQLDGFRTQRPADVKAYLTSDDVQSTRPLKAQLRFPPRAKASLSVRRQSSLLPRYALVLSVMALILAFMAYVVPTLKASKSIHVPGFPTHLESLARGTRAQTQTKRGAKGDSVPSMTTASTPSALWHHPEASEAPTAASIPAVHAAAAEASVLDGFKLTEASERMTFISQETTVEDDAATIDDNYDDQDNDSLDALTSTTLWQRWLDSFFGLFKWMRAV
ncbi:hypothetical protein A4X06_0g378 [Tilletia controversa]|uniref:Uncharacterized protein n=1 Tax=Tilletia controversa TaxID=13291 RepID=A0A8X7N1G0_9BASI|nr:hypothetical protein CF328_g65 [Tilletia controversa]KAE8255542.1 hypothetical protein A4X06_0g378 [Tilletia controversa]